VSRRRPAVSAADGIGAPEGVGIDEGARERAVVGGQWVQLERRRRDAQRRSPEATVAGGDEPEARVVARVALQEHERFVAGRGEQLQRLGDQPRADAESVVVGTHADRAEQQHVDEAIGRVDDRVGVEHVGDDLAGVRRGRIRHELRHEGHLVLPRP
jgi:hypothetical protein